MDSLHPQIVYSVYLYPFSSAVSLNFARTKQRTKSEGEFESCVHAGKENWGILVPNATRLSFFLKDGGGKRKFNYSALTLLGTLQNGQASYGKLHSNDFPSLLFKVVFYFFFGGIIFSCDRFCCGSHEAKKVPNYFPKMGTYVLFFNFP